MSRMKLGKSDELVLKYIHYKGWVGFAFPP